MSNGGFNSLHIIGFLLKVKSLIGVSIRGIFLREITSTPDSVACSCCIIAWIQRMSSQDYLFDIENLFNEFIRFHHEFANSQTIRK